MKHFPKTTYPAILIMLFVSFSGMAQCDTSVIYNTTSTNAVCWDTTFSKVRNCYSNNLPDHPDSYGGNFTIAASDQEYSMCLYPDTASAFTPMYETTETAFGCNYTYQFGVGLNGAGYTPNSNLTFVDSSGANNLNWHKEASFMFAASIGNNGGHLNSFGSYHYHNPPVDYFVDSLGMSSSTHSPIVGYAADGFPIYYKYVYSDPNDAASSITSLSSGYTLKSGSRPGDGLTAPDGQYTGLYYEDYEYTTTTLDECNGRWAVTPDFPTGTYYYVLTDEYPQIPRCFKGTVLDNTFRSLANCPASTASTDCSDAPAVVSGCTDPFSCTYNPSATVDDGSCVYYYYENLTVVTTGNYTSPSGNIYTSSQVFNDTVVLSGCDSVYTIDLTINTNSISEYVGSYITVSPNPVKDQLSIKSEERMSRVTVFNSFGQKVIVQEATESTVEIATKSLAPGIYYVNVLMESELTAIERIVVQ